MQIEPNENASKRMESSVCIIPFANDGKPRDAGGVYSNHKGGSIPHLTHGIEPPRDAGGVYSNHKGGSIPCVRCADSLAKRLPRSSSIRSFVGITATARHKEHFQPTAAATISWPGSSLKRGDE